MGGIYQATVDLAKDFTFTDPNSLNNLTATIVTDAWIAGRSQSTAICNDCGGYGINRLDYQLCVVTP